MSISLEAALAELAELFGERLDTAPHRRYHGDIVSDHSLHTRPAALVAPETTDEVAALMRIASTHGIPVTARGGGSGLAGGAIAAAGGILCTLERMTAVRDIDATSMMVEVEAGVVTSTLDEHLAPHGLFFAGYPMSEEICTIGGNIATNAGGGRAVRYGVTGSHVFGLEVVTAAGDVLHLGGRRYKDVTGLNILPLFVGSEGTLGIITAATLRLMPRPVHREAMLARFETSEAAIDAVRALRLVAGGAPSAIEYVDGETARATEAGRRTRDRLACDLEGCAAVLLVEVEARTGDELATLSDAYRAAIEAAGGVMAPGSDTDSLWAFRKAVPWWVKREAGQYHSVEDVVVPISAIPQLVTGARGIAAASPLRVAIFGHAGDGNFHVNPMKPPELAAEQWPDALAEFLKQLYALAVSLGGTISGEHGIGRKRVGYLGTALAPAEIAAMQAVKRALDPDGILNPGVLLP